MVKKISKEIVIIILLLVAIVLVLGVFLYDYIPTSKIVPKIEPYEVAESVKKELSEEVSDDQGQTVITYEVDDTDLTMYEKGKDYQKGKANPFGDSTTNTTNSTNTTNTTNTAGNTTTNTVVSNTANQNSDSVGNYLPDTGTK